MLLNLKKLNESIENKYILDESQTLNEKFSDSMPDWLGKRILTTKYATNGNSYGRDFGIHKSSKDAKLNKIEPDWKKVPTYAGKRGADKHNDQSLFGRFLARGIDLDNVKIIEGPNPEKRTDPRLKEPNIPIFLLKNGQVYAQGLNDQEEYKEDENYRPFKNIPIKTLLADVEKFAYIDGNDDTNFTIKQKKSDRQLSKAELSKIPYYERDRVNAGAKDRYISGKGWVSIDKSGYFIVPTMDKYRDKLAELKCDKIHDILREKEDYLNSVKEELANILMNTDIRNDVGASGSDFQTAFSNIFSWFKEAVGYLQSVDAQLNTILNNSPYTDEEKRQQIIRLINDRFGDYKDLIETVGKIEKASSTVFNSIIDWI